MSIAEALVRGVPVIASSRTPWRRVEEMRCGLWVDNSAESLAEAIRRIRRMPVAEMGRRGREWMQTEFTWESKARRMAALYSELAGVKPAALRAAS
jgi:glycosyltransferase involved in cell wall biosynthesis